MVKGGDKLEARLREMVKSLDAAEKVRVGFLENSKYPDGTPTAMIAAIHNYGAPAAGIPPRPFFSSMIAEKESGWGEDLGKSLVAKNFNAKNALGFMGERIKGQLQDSIVNGSYAPLKPATIKRKGFDTPLIDTSHMLNSVDYEVV